MTTPQKATVSEAIARPVRGAAQGSAAWLVTEGIDLFLRDLTDRQYGFSVLALGVVFSYVQNTLENRRGKGFFLRSVPPKDVPVEGE